MGGLAFAVSCGDEPLAPTAGDRVPEVSLSGARLVSEFAHEVGYLVSPPLFAPDRATTVGLMIDVQRDRPDATVELEARGIDRFGRPAPWVKAQVTWQEAELRVARADLGVAAVEAQIRIAREQASELAFVTWSAVVPMPAEDPPFAVLDRGGIRTDRRELSASLAAGGVKSRADWGARATQCTATDPVKTRMAVHHTVTPASSGNGYEARLRQIQAFHMDTRGWCDVGYHFLVTTDGSVWEAREARFLGAHVANQNANNVGVSFVGCFHPGDATCDQPEFQPSTPPEAMILGGGNVIGLLKNEYGIPVNDGTVIGHRDHAGAQTSCPGNALHSQLARLRDIANGVNPGPVTGRINGVVWDASVTSGPADPGNVRIPGAMVTCSCGQQAQARSGDALWSFDIEPGLYTFTAEAPGFATASRELMITGNQEIWGSIGLVPMQQAIEVGVRVTDEAGAPVEGAEVALGALGAAQTGGDGTVRFTAPEGGSGTLTVRKEGFERHQREVSWAAAVTIDVQLLRLIVSVEPAEPRDLADDTPAVRANDPEPGDELPEEEKGCGCTAAHRRSGTSPWLLLLSFALVVRSMVRSGRASGSAQRAKRAEAGGPGLARTGSRSAGLRPRRLPSDRAVR